MMTGNVSKDDRIIRIVIGLWFISMVYIGPETLWGWVGLVPLLSAIVGFCPLYKKLGFDTKKAVGENQAVIKDSDVAEDIPERRAGVS